MQLGLIIGLMLIQVVYVWAFGEDMREEEGERYF